MRKLRTEDGYIVRRVLNGEPEAFGLLVDRYKASIYAFAYVKLRNFHDAEDVAQEVFIKAYQKLRELRRYDSFLAWLYSIASDLCRKFIRAQSKRPDREFIEDQEPEVQAGISTDSYQDDAEYEFLHEALDSLPEMYRQVLTLYYLGGMTCREIARFLGKSPTAVRQRLSRARVQLREEVLAMTRTTFEGQRLQASFTFRIVEAVRRIKVHPMPRAAGLPWGLSLAAGIIATVMSLNPDIAIQNPTSMPAGSSLTSQAKVLKTGEIPVDILNTSQIPAITSKQGDGRDGTMKPADQQKAFHLAPAAEGDTWTAKADMPTARHETQTSVVNGKIYAIGGWISGAGGDGGEPSQAVEEYDPIRDRWTKKSDMPTPRTSLSTSVVNGRIYAIGGWTGNNVLQVVEEYDPVADIWAKKAVMPAARGLLSASVVNGKIYAIGGYDDGQHIVSTVEEYDPAKDTWTKKADMPTARGWLSTSLVNNRIYAIGGGGDANKDMPLKTVEEYDPATDTWTRKADMPTARFGLATGVVNGKIYAIGGTTGIFNFNSAFSEVEIYDPVMDRWEVGSAMPTARAWLSSSAVNGKIYAIGGRTGAKVDLPIVEEYTPEGWPFAVSPQLKLPTKWGEVK